jgi:hypothetical protein
LCYFPRNSLEVPMVTRHLTAAIEKMGIGTSGPYMSDDDIAKQFENYTVEKLEIKFRDGVPKSGLLVLRFPEESEMIGSGSDTSVDHFVVYDPPTGTKGPDGFEIATYARIAHDQWYPQELQNEVNDLINEAIVNDPQFDNDAATFDSTEFNTMNPW